MTQCGVISVLVLALIPGTAFAVVPAVAIPKTVGNFNNPAVMPVNSSPFGLSYGQWSARFWQWQFSLPVNANPIFDTADCSAGQSGKVWFLGGSALPFEISPGVLLARVTRTCTVPSGTALFVPIVNNECSTIPGDQLPGFSPTPADLEPCAKFASSFIVPGTLSASLDETRIKALTQYELASPLFTFGPLPDNNVLQFFGLVAPAGTTAQSVNDGIHLMLHPLSTGNHVLRFYAELDLGPIGGPKFIQDITYYIRVSH
jgi:hypothetical protein